jgi:hypothetical protein
LSLGQNLVQRYIIEPGGYMVDRLCWTLKRQSRDIALDAEDAAAFWLFAVRIEQRIAIVKLEYNHLKSGGWDTTAWTVEESTSQELEASFLVEGGSNIEICTTPTDKSSIWPC